MYVGSDEDASDGGLENRIAFLDGEKEGAEGRVGPPVEDLDGDREAPRRAKRVVSASSIEDDGCCV